MKKILSVLLSLLLLCSCIPLGAVTAASAGTVYGTVDQSDVAPGDTFTMSVQMENNPGLVCWLIDVDFDSAALELVSQTKGDAFNGMGTFSFGPIKEGYTNALWYDFLAMDNYTNNGHLFSLTFRVKEGAPAGDYPITLYCSDWDNMCNVYFERADFDFVSPTVTVVAAEEPACEHEYFYACDRYCMNCYELTNPDAQHSITYVEAVAPTCDTMGNIAYWFCELCGTAWLNAECTQVTNRKAVQLPAMGHVYDDDYDADCNTCGETRDVPDMPVAGSEVTLDFHDKANRVSYTTEQQVWAQNGITVTNDKAGSVSNVGDYGGEGFPARFYKGSALTVEYAGMTKIVFNCDDYKASYPTDLAASITTGTVSVDGTAVTVIFDAPVDSLFIEALAAQVRMDSIVVYASEGGDEPVDPEPPVEPDPEPPVGDEWTVATELKEGVAYKLGLDQIAESAVYYFTGAMNGYYGATSTSVVAAVDMFVEVVDGGYKLYFFDVYGVKQYIKLALWGSSYYDFTFGDEGSVFTLDTERNALYTTVGDQICYMGTYGDYVTIGTLRADKLTDTDYIARLYTNAGSDGPAEPSFDGYLVNGNFETGDATAWELWQSSEISSEAAVEGAYGAHLMGNGGWGGLMNQTFSVVPGETYSFLFGIQVNSVGVNVQILDGNGISIKNDWLDKVRYGEWASWSCAVIATTDTMTLNFCGSGTGMAEDAYVDAIWVSEVTEHLYGSAVTVSPTCGTEGLMTYTCIGCGRTYTETIPATGDHRYDDPYDTDCNACGAIRDVPEKPAVPLQFFVEDAEVQRGDFFTVAVQVKNNPGLISFRLGVSYDTSLLELTDCTLGNTFSESCMSHGYITNVPFTISWVDALYPNNTDDGVVVWLTFRAKAGTTSSQTNLDLICYDSSDMFNDAWEDVPFVLRSGTVVLTDSEPEEPDVPVVGSEATLSFHDIANRVSYSAEQQVWAQNGITVTNDKAGSTTNVGNYGGDGYPARFYKNTALTIEYPGMTKIVFYCDDYKDTYATDLAASITTGTVSVDGTAVTVIFDAPVDSLYIEALAAQVRMDSIVVYASEGGDEPVDPEPGCQHEYFFPCDQHCMLCGELTNPGAVHALSYVAAVKATCITSGNIAYWNCADCGMCWNNAAATGTSFDKQMTILPATGVHTYSDAADASCNECGAIRVVGGATIYGVVSDTAVECGDTFTLDVYIRDNPGLVGWNVTVEYNETALELVQVTPGNVFPAASMSYGLFKSPFSTTFMDAIHPDVTGDGVMVSLTFRVKDNATPGDYTFVLGTRNNDLDNFCNANWDTIPVQFENTSVSVFAHTHTYVGVVTKDPTCGTAGVMIYTCSDCGDSYIGSIPATGNHTYDNAFNCVQCGYSLSVIYGTVDADLVAPGDTFTLAVHMANNPGLVGWLLDVDFDSTALELVSQTKGEAFDGIGTFSFGPMMEGYTNALWYDFLTMVDYTNNGCMFYLTFRVKEGVSNGITSIHLYCSDTDNLCNAQFESVDVVFVDAGVTLLDHRHAYDNACDAICNICGAVREVEPHAYESEVTKAPTCVVDGVMTYTCTVCGDSYTEAIASNGQHAYKSVVTAPDCINGGYTTYTCTVCGSAYVTDYTAALGHDYASEITLAATCGTNGVMTYICSACGDTYTEVIPATGKHTYASVITLAPTCAVEGIKTYTCSVCGDSYTEVIPATGDHTYDNACDATCNVCGGVREVPGHSFVGNYTCEVCGYTLNVNSDPIIQGTVDMTDAAPGETVILTVDMTNNPGLSGWLVGVDYDAQSLELIEQTAGDIFNPVAFGPMDTLPTRVSWYDFLNGDNTASGVMFRFTFRVKEGVATGDTVIKLYSTDPDNFTTVDEQTVHFNFVSAVVSLLDHRHVYESAVTTAATCGADGLMTYTCSICGHSYTEVIPATGDHTYESAVTTAPTCVAEGVLTYTCSVCGDSYTESIPATGVHTYDDDDDATCNDCDYVRDLTDPGDVNKDGKINIRDVGLMLQWINGWDVELDEKIADVNNDGVVNTRDVGLIRQWLNGWDVELI